ncbi:hypothetical protein [Xanthomonas oryzae]|nr:hypothetical protein [Xanthomonas oryzae]RBK83637.1 hypothetical protein BRN77_08280 [Xanthomonas oryzae pv. oryzae]UXW31162.1 hypothetical protein IXO644_021425 [Xanthomonas oryzae pv. oryzae]UZF12338.1 hypothetical protein IXO645_021480 [Xanthomonas oryzae pv. oryzae]
MIGGKYRRSLDSYLFSDSGVGRRIPLTRFISTLSAHLPETVVFGGMIREFALGKSRSFRSDVDVVTAHEDEEIITLISEFSPQKNKFGGYRFSVDGWLFDIWSLESTWAIKKGLVPSTGFDALLSTTFFDLDSAVFHLSERVLYCSSMHQEALEKRTLGINLRENPNPESMACRAVNLALENDFALTRELAEFVVDNYRSHGEQGIVRSYLLALEEMLRGDAGIKSLKPRLQSRLWSD